MEKEWFPADLVILAAGGLGTPQVLQDSGIACEAALFVDPVLCVAAEMPGSFQNRELPMPFAVQKKGYIISPYFDHLSFFFNRDWLRRSGNIYSLMIKLADDNQGSLPGGRVRESADRRRPGAPAGGRRHLRRDVPPRRRRQGAAFFRDPQRRASRGHVAPDRGQAGTLHDPRLPENLFVADASLFPAALGNPPILTIMALAKRISGLCGNGRG